MTPLRDLAPIRWLHQVRDFLRRRREMYDPPPPTVSFDEARVHILQASGKDDGFPWEAVRRIGYRTTDSWYSDLFLEFQLTGGRVVWIDPCGPGAPALVEHVDHLPDSRLDPKRGHLANVIGNDSIIIWPSREAGRSLDD